MGSYIPTFQGEGMGHDNGPVKMFSHKFIRKFHSAIPCAQATQEPEDAGRLQADKSPEQMRRIKETYLEYITRHDPKNG